ncbi:uncharacterized protein LOC143921260 [Arctopsyche grandis]|uniref:uncharacterized protein LOC143921260 n=1 Tax=Arctopsyche grandis TaxID=121162 RepID=UPI00406D6479
MKCKSLILATAILIINCFTTVHSVIKDTELIEYRKYMQNVLQTFIYDLEDVGFCTLRLKDFKQQINETLYNFDVIGTLYYSSGFVIGLNSADIKFNQINRILDESAMTATIYTTLETDGIRIAYDVEGHMDDSSIHRATGIYLVKGFEWIVHITKVLDTNQINVTMSLSQREHDQTERIKFLPKNDYTAVFSRLFTPAIDEVSESFHAWIPSNFIPILEKIVREKIPFPELSYESHLDLNS